MKHIYAVITALALATAARGNMIENGSFEIFGWKTVTDWSPSWLDVESLDWTSAEGSWCLDMNGWGPYPATIYQDVPTTAGTTYYLSFALSGNTDHQQYGTLKRLEVYWDGALLSTEHIDIAGYNWDNVPWYWFQYPVIASGDITRVQFTSLEWGHLGPLLDDAVLDVNERTLPNPGPQPDPPSGVPEDGSTLALFALAMVPLIRRK